MKIDKIRILDLCCILGWEQFFSIYDESGRVGSFDGCVIESGHGKWTLDGKSVHHRPKTYMFPALMTCIAVHWWWFDADGSDVGQINEVTLRRAGLVLGWVTVSGFNSRCGKFISV